MIDAINRNCHNVVFIMWGLYAQKKGAKIDLVRVALRLFVYYDLFAVMFVMFTMHLPCVCVAFAGKALGVEGCSSISSLCHKVLRYVQHARDILNIIILLLLSLFQGLLLLLF